MTPQQTQIINLLLDGNTHCPTVELFMKDDRTRISELRKMGYVFDESAGICKEPTHNHGSKVKLRKLLSTPYDYTQPPNTSIGSDICSTCGWFINHSPECKKVGIKQGIMNI